MEFFTDQTMRDHSPAASTLQLWTQTASTMSVVGPGSAGSDYIDWLTIINNALSVAQDVTRIRTHPLVPNRIPIYGYIDDVTTGLLVEVPDATRAGQPS